MAPQSPENSVPSRIPPVASPWAELDGLPVGVAVVEENGRVVRSNDRWLSMMGAGQTPIPNGEALLVDREEGESGWTVRVVRVARWRDRLTVLVAEDVTEAAFAGADLDTPQRPMPLTVLPFAPAGVIHDGERLIEHVVERLWSPVVLIAEDSARVCYANAASRRDHGFRIGESVEHALPLRLSRETHEYYECMLRRGPGGILCPVRVWPVDVRGVASFVMLEPGSVPHGAMVAAAATRRGLTAAS